MTFNTVSLLAFGLLAGCQSSFVPDDFVVPVALETRAFRIRPLVATDAEMDYEAVMESVDLIHQALLDDAWPTPSFTLEENRRQLERKERDFDRRLRFTYAVLTPDERRVLGSVYINPGVRGPDAAVFFWVRRSAHDAGFDPILERTVRQWMADEWPFAWVVYPGRDAERIAGESTTRATPGAITDGGWLGQAGPDFFLFEFATAGDSLTGTSHWIQDGKAISELPMRSVRYADGEIEAHAPTGAVLSGPVDLANGIIHGKLSYPSGPGPDMELRWVEPDAVSGRPARPPPPPGAPRSVYRRPPDLGDGWATAMPRDVGISPAAVDALVEAILDGQAGVLHSILVARNGKLVVEEYFHGYRRPDLDPIMSCTKSVASLLVGLAIDQASIAGVDVPLLDFFPELRSATGTGWDALRLEHLLTMSMGLDWSDREAENVHGTGPDFFGQVLTRDVTGTPGERWRYVNADVNLLAGVIRQATGEQADAFAEQNLFEPLGIDRYDWSAGKAAGYPLMDGSLRLTPRGMAKLGALVLDGGRWNGRQVVSEAWVRAATSARIPAPEGDGSYGYLWWVGGPQAPSGASHDLVWANGWGSQFILVFPDLDLVVVTTGGNQDNGKHMAIGTVLYETLLAGMDGSGGR